MAGLCGWNWTKAGDRAELDRVQNANRVLTRIGNGDTQIISGERFTLINAARTGFGSSVENGRGSAAVYGVPSTSDKALEGRFAAVGPAAAILEAYESSGTHFLASLSGTFALAIVADEGDNIFIATDQVGSVPWNYVATDCGLAFSTTLRALPVFPIHKLEIDEQAIFHYLYFHAIPTPYSAYRGVRKLRPCQWLRWKKDKLQTGEYRRYRWAPESSASFDRGERKAEFFRILDRVVERSIEDEPNFGCFLSGGTDSSTLAGVLSTRLDRHTKTYSIGFDEPGYDEMDYARIAAQHFGTEHHEYYVTRRDVADLIPKICEVYEEPFGNSSAVPTYFCAQMAGRDNVQRMVAGDGGDELFGGNTRYSDQLTFSYYDSLPAGLKKSLIRPAASALPLGLFFTRKVRRYVERAEIPMPIRMFSYNHLRMLGLENVLHPDFLARIDRAKPETDLAETYQSADAENMIDRMLALDLKFTITDNDLPKVVTMCDLAGRDVVFPFLMDEMIKFSTIIPPELKVRRNKLRVFFKEALSEFLPAEIIKKKKHGFGLPFGMWLSRDDDLRAIAHESLTGLARRGIVREKFVHELLSGLLEQHPAYYGGFAWVLIQLELWYQSHETN